MAKTNWQMGDTVQPADLNQIGQEINENTADLAEHRSASVLDHPDGSVTTEKLANGAVTAAKVAADVAKSADLAAHANMTSSVHGATSAATANRIIQRDSAGRAKVAAPAASDDIARKDTVDAVQTNLNSRKSAAVLDHPDGSVTTAKLADGAVTSAKLASGAVTSAKLASGSATDTAIGNRTISDTSAPTGDTGTPTNLWSWLAYMIKAITGKSNWRTAPATTLEAAAAHAARTDNPHAVTKSQVGLGSVQNYGIASQAQAEAGTASNVYMTPQRVKQYVDKRLLNNLTFRVNDGAVEFSTDGGGSWNAMGFDPTTKTLNFINHYSTGLSIAPGTSVNLYTINGPAILHELKVMLYASYANAIGLELVVDGVVKPLYFNDNGYQRSVYDTALEFIGQTTTPVGTFMSYLAIKCNSSITLRAKNLSASNYPSNVAVVIRGGYYT